MTRIVSFLAKPSRMYTTVFRMRQHKRLPSEPTQPREKRGKVCADKFQNMACIYFYEDRKITIRIQI